MKIKVEMVLVAADKQPKHSVRYEFKSGSAGVETVYVKRSAFEGEPPHRIEVEITGLYHHTSNIRTY